MVGASYANALVELASESDELEKVHQDMDALASVLAENADVRPCCSLSASLTPNARNRTVLLRVHLSSGALGCVLEKLLNLPPNFCARTIMLLQCRLGVSRAWSATFPRQSFSLRVRAPAARARPVG